MTAILPPAGTSSVSGTTTITSRTTSGGSVTTASFAQNVKFAGLASMTSSKNGTDKAVVKYTVDTAHSSFNGMYVESQNSLLSSLVGCGVFILLVLVILKANHWLKNSGEKKKN